MIDRGLATLDGSTPDIMQRARRRVDELVGSYERHPLSTEAEQELIGFAQREAKPARLDGLPGILAGEFAHHPNLTK